MAMMSTEEISRRLSHTLDCLGYGPGMVRFRKNAWNAFDQILNWPLRKNFLNICGRAVGSRGEGMVKFYESDWDQLIIYRDVIVVEDIINVQYIPEPISVFLMVPCLLHPGHCKLLLVRKGTGEHLTDNCLNPFENGYWLSSKELMTRDVGGCNFSVSGPAQTGILLTDYSADFVLTFPCVCSRTLHQWLQRPRRYDWPPIELRDQITRMTGNIVATGQKGCPDEEIEWRLCFNEFELLLVDTWNDTQRKLYKVLKMIKKDAIDKEGFNISSYIMKNIVLWFSETYPQSEFRPENLMLWVFKSLKLLRKAIKVYNLPYYMILGRNLIAERVPQCQRKSLIKEISDLIHCGPKLLWECEKLEFAMSMTLNELLYYCDRCDRFEVLTMRRFICHQYSEDTNTDNTQLIKEIEKEMAVICLISPWPPVVSKKINKYGFHYLLS